MRKALNKSDTSNNAILQFIDNETLWCYRYQKVLHEIVDDDFLCAKMEVFKELCLKDGDYQIKEDK